MQHMRLYGTAHDAPAVPPGCRYTHLLRLLESTRDYQEQEQLDRAEALKISLTSNLALAAFQQAEYVRSIEWCDKTLQLDPDNAKVCWNCVCGVQGLCLRC